MLISVNYGYALETSVDLYGERSDAQWGQMKKKEMEKIIASLVETIKVTFISGENVRFHVYFITLFPSQ